MFSYRHGFHAGNHADVLKHVVLIFLLDYLTQKQKSLCMIDTHAGAGIYNLESAYAQKSGEWCNGIGKLRKVKKLSTPLKRYLEIIDHFNSAASRHETTPRSEQQPEEKIHDERKNIYPGSPAIGATLLRKEDSLHLFELHPTDLLTLQENFSHKHTNKTAHFSPRIQVQDSNGFAALKALLPPPSRRGLVLIDPPYEDKQDYAAVVEAIHAGLTRFATGTYAIWYPCLGRQESRRLPQQLKQLPIKHWLQAELAISGDTQAGLVRSGLFIINPPWTLKATLQTLLPELVTILQCDNRAEYFLEEQQNQPSTLRALD